jgi:hypothetical protein
MSAMASPPPVIRTATSQDPAPDVRRGEPAPRQRAGQGVGQSHSVGQQPGRHVPGVRHDTRPVGGE